MHEQQTKKVKHAQDPGITSLYPANIGSGGSWVRGHGLAVGRGKKKHIMGLLLKLFWEKYPVGMTCHPKEVRMSWNHQVHAMRDRERESTHTVTGRKSHSKQTNKQNSILCLAEGNSTDKWWWLNH